MSEIIYIIKIMYYFGFVFLLYYSCKINFVWRKDERAISHDSSKVNWVAIIFLCVIIGYYAIICGQKPVASDRLNYAFRFEDDGYADWIKGDSLGLFWLSALLHFISYDPSVLFFSVAFLSLFVTILAYNQYEKKSHIALLLMGLSSYVYYSFFLLKQAPAMALSSLAIAMYFKRKWIPCAICVIGAICFHEAGWIMLPVLLAAYFSKSRLLRKVLILLLLLCVLLFPYISRLLVAFFTIIPGLGKQLEIFLDASGGIAIDINILTTFKGIPYYFVAIVAFVKRKVLEKRIEHFQEYFFMTVFVSATFMLSAYMYWMWRFGAICYLPVFIFAAQIYKNMKNCVDKKIFIIFEAFMHGGLTAYALYQYYFWYGGF